MKYALVALLTLALGGLAARAIWLEKQQAVDPLQIIVTQLKTHALVEHERQVAIWYRACPDVIGIDPQIFIAWPAKLSYEVELGDVTVTREGSRIKVRTSGIRADEPSVPTDFIDYLSSNSLLNFANEQELINREIGKASMIARYLSTYFLTSDASLRGDFARELQALVARLAAALGVDASQIDVEIPADKPKLPKLPKLELCEGSMASVNGLPFAHLQDGFTVPVRFEPAPSARYLDRSSQKDAAAPQGIASLYGRAPR